MVDKIVEHGPGTPIDEIQPRIRGRKGTVELTAALTPTLLRNCVDRAARHQRCYVVKYCAVNYANLGSTGKRTRLVSR